MNTEAAERKARSLRAARCKEKVQKGGTMVQSGGACKVVRRSPGPDPGCSAREPSPPQVRLALPLVQIELLLAAHPRVESGGGEERRRGGYEGIRRSW